MARIRLRIRVRARVRVRARARVRAGARLRAGVRVRLRARVRVLDLTSQTALLRRLSSSKLGRHLRSSATSSRR